MHRFVLSRRVVSLLTGSAIVLSVLSVAPVAANAAPATAESSSTPSPEATPASTQKVGPKKVGPKKVGPKKVEPKKVEPKKVEPKKVEPKKVEPTSTAARRPAARSALAPGQSCTATTLASFGTSLPVTAQRAGSGTDCYTFTTDAYGVYAVRFVEQSPNWSAAVIVTDNSSNVIFNQWSDGLSLVTLQAARSYTVEVGGTPGAGSATYQLGVFEVNDSSGCPTAASTAFGAPIEGKFADGSEVTCRQLTDPKGTLYRAGTVMDESRTASLVFDAKGNQACSWTAGDPANFGDCQLIGTAPFRLVTRSRYDTGGAGGTYRTWLDDVTSAQGCAAGALTEWDAAPAISADRGDDAADCFTVTSATFGRYAVRFTQDSARWTSRLTVYDPSGRQVREGYGGYTTIEFKANLTYRVVVSGSPNGYPPQFRVALTQISGSGATCPSAASTDWNSAGSPIELTTGAELDCKQLSDAAGSTILLTPANDLTFEVVNAGGASLCQYQGSNTGSVNCRLTGAAPYRVVSRSGSNGADFAPTDTTLWAYNIAATAGCATSPLASWGQQLPAAVDRTSRGVECVHVTSNAFGRYLLRLTQDNPSWTATATVYAPDGSQLYSSSAGQGTVQFKATSTYTVVLTGDPNGYPPQLHLGVFELAGAGCADVPDLGWNSTGTVDTFAGGGELTCRELPNSVGRAVRVLTRSTARDFVQYSSLYDGDGNLVCSVRVDSPLACALTGPAPYRLISRSGYYSTDVTPGSVRLWVSDLSSSADCRSIDSTQAVVAPSLSGTLVPSRAASCWSSGLVREDRAWLSIVSTTSSTVSAELVSAAGVTFCSVDSPSGHTSSCALTSPGPYTVVVHGANGDDSGYRVALHKLSDPVGCQQVDDIASGFPAVGGSLPATDSVACVRFTVGAGDQMIFDARNPSGQSLQYADIYRPNGDLLCTPRYYSPSQCTFDREGTYTATVTPGTVGRFTLSSTCVNPACGPDVFTLAGVSPSQVGRGGSATVTVLGKALDTADVVEAVRGGTTVKGRPLSVTSDGRQMYVTFDFSSAPFGVYDIRVTTPRDGVQLARSALTVVAIQDPHIETGVVSLGRFVAGRPQTVSITVRNTGNIDALGAPLIIDGLPAGSTITPLFPLTGTSSVDGPVQQTPWNPSRSVYSGADSSMGTQLFLGNIPPGGTHQYDFSLNVPSASDYNLKASSTECSVNSKEPGGKASEDGCTEAMLDLALNFIPGGPCVGLGIDAVRAIRRNVVEGAPPFQAASGSEMVWSGLGAVSCVASLFPPAELIEKVLEGASLAKNIVNTGKECFSGPTAHQRSVSSLDPNELAGPLGGGAKHAVPGGGTHTFGVFFENSPKATAPAQEVHVVDRLDPAQYDLSTVRFRSVQFGDTRWTPASDSATIDHTLDIGSGLQLAMSAKASGDGRVTWALDTEDVLTGELPTDPERGFLPPDTDGKVGQGVLYFDVRPKAVADGTTLSSKAEVTFDLNPPIETNTWTNLVDLTAPTAKASAPATSTSPTFAVTWNGADATSGVAGYDVLVATDSGPYVTWREGVAAGSASYTGAVGHTYRFSAVAHDFAGNVSTLPPTPDATTAVIPPRLAFAATPTVTGSPTVGATLSAGRLATSPAATTTTIQWLRDGRVITGASRTTYAVGPADVGHRLGVRVVASRTGYTSAQALSAATRAVVRATPAVTASASSPKKATVVVRVGVTTARKPIANAKVSVLEGRKVLRTVTLRSGSGPITLTRVRAGVHTYVVVFAGNAGVAPARVTARAVRVR